MTHEEYRQQSLEKQLKMWNKRLNELRNIGTAALDASFIRRQCTKCQAEIKRIESILSEL